MVNILTIAGSDSISGAGIQQDIKTIEYLGGYAMCAITALTAQNTKEINDINIVTPTFLKKQIDTVIKDIKPDGVKIGMLGNHKNANVVCNTLQKYNLKNIVYDPVFISTSGQNLFENELDTIKDIFPHIDLLTPNIHEAKKLTGLKIENITDMKKATCYLRKMGCKNILLKGGHLKTNNITDVLLYNEKFFLFEHSKIANGPFHGTGCFLSSAICTFLAQNISCEKACIKSIDIICNKIRSAKKIGSGQLILTIKEQ